MNIAILASVGCQNLGDELILKNEINLLEKKYKSKKIKFRVFSYDYKNPFFEQDNIEYLEYFPIGIKNYKNIFKNINNYLKFLKTIIWSDLIVIGGGGIFYDNEKQSVNGPLNSWLFRINTINFFRKKILFYGVGIDIGNKASYIKVKKIFSKSKEILVRDKLSYKLLNSLGIKSQVILDPVFSDNNLNSVLEVKNCIKKVKSDKFSINILDNIDLKDKKVGIAFRSGYFSNNKNRKLGNNLEKLKIKELISHIIGSGGKVILLPHSFHKTDIIANDHIFLKQFLGKHITISNNMKETYKYYSKNKIDLCLSQRLHSMILSEVYNIKFVGFTYGKKTEELLK